VPSKCARAILPGTSMPEVGQRTSAHDWNPRYLAYCVAHGCSPDEMLAQDDERWPGGVMCGFILRIDARWGEWKRLKGYGRNHILSEGDHVEFDAWLGLCAGQKEAA
jgi:hypothetical protein